MQISHSRISQQDAGFLHASRHRFDLKAIKNRDRLITDHTRVIFHSKESNFECPVQST